MLAMSIIPLIVTSIYNLSNSKNALEKAALEKLVAVREAKNEGISRYLNTISSQVLTLAHDKMIIEAARDFSSSFKKVPAASGDAEVKLREYYTKSFADEYKNKTGETSPHDNTVSLLSPKSIMIQHAFISNNSNPLGSKHLLDETPLLQEYSNFHKIYHPIIREYLETFSYYDIFIVDIESGDIVYSVFKELDFATNLYTGPYKDSNLAEAIKVAKEIKDPKEFKIVDFKKYSPSYESPASFIAAPIWENGKKIAILAFQMPLATINDIMSDRAGLGASGETYLVGSDKRLRSDTFTDKDFNIFNSFNKEKLINTKNVELAIGGKSGSELSTNFNDVEVLSAYTKIKFPHLNWVILAEQTTKEAFSEASDLSFKISIFILISIIIVILISLMISGNLSKQISEIVESFSKSAHDVQNSSQKMDLISNKLHKSVQTQISCITESAAAMDEISAMLKNNTSSSQNATSLSNHSKSSALKGKETVEKLISEVDEISKSYDEIQQSVDKNNADIASIVQVISEIANKTKVINDIVFQTKLLSFNASVEAARAGESGKGFAVVAEEIANLAAMSGTAANDIAQMLTSSQNQVREIAEATKRNIGSIVKNGRDKVTNGKEVSTQCMSQLDNILSSVNELDSSIKEINFAIQEQSTGVEEVNSAMKYLENATHETTDMSERSKAASEELHAQSHSLRSSIQELRKVLGAEKNYDVDDG